MKRISMLLLFLLALTVGFVACERVDQAETEVEEVVEQDTSLVEGDSVEAEAAE